jgi:uncharacterized RDD family membrane protein YckC
MDNQLLDENLSHNFADPEQLELASQGTRFGTYIIDRIICLGLSIVLAGAYFVGNPGAADSFDDNAMNSKLLDYALGYLTAVIYYSIFEGIFKGRSIGKMICGTRAVTVDGEIMSFGTVLQRTFCRIVPFDALSFLGAIGNGWHDRWSDTMVVTENSYQTSLRSM